MSLAAGTYPYKAPPKNANNTIGFYKELLLVIQNLYDGKVQCTGQFSLTPSVTTTVVKDPRCSEQSIAFLSPFTANALTAQATSYVSSYGQGQFTVTHTSTASTDRTFRYAILG